MATGKGTEAAAVAQAALTDDPEFLRWLVEGVVQEFLEAKVADTESEATYQDLFRRLKARGHRPAIPGGELAALPGPLRPQPAGAGRRGPPPGAVSRSAALLRRDDAGAGNGRGCGGCCALAGEPPEGGDDARGGAGGLPGLSRLPARAPAPPTVWKWRHHRAPFRLDAVDPRRRAPLPRAGRPVGVVTAWPPRCVVAPLPSRRWAMAGRRVNEALVLRRDFVRADDAERRWRRAFQVLLQVAPAVPASPAAEEGRDGHDGGGLRAGFDGAASRAADD